MSGSPSKIPRLISGMSRGGTTWVNRLFNGHPDVASFGETSFWGRGYTAAAGPDGRYDQHQLEQVVGKLRHCNLGPPNTEPGGLEYVNKQTQPDIIDQAFADVTAPVTPAEVFDRLGQAIAKAEGKLCWIEKTPHHINWVDHIFHAMPEAKMLVMVRDPYGFMLSYKHQGDRQPTETRKVLHRLYHPLGCALIWRGYMRSVQYAQRRYPERVMVTSITDIVRSPEPMMERIQRFLELRPVEGLTDRVPPANSSFPGGVKRELQANDLFWMNLIAKRLICQSGFEPRATPPGFISILVSVLRLPVWGFHVMSVFFKQRGWGAVSYLWRWIKPSRDK